MVLPGSKFPVVQDVTRVRAGHPYSGAYFPPTFVLIVLWSATGTLDIHAPSSSPDSEWDGGRGANQFEWLRLKGFAFVIQRQESFGKTHLSILHSNMFCKMRSPSSPPTFLCHPKVLVIQNKRRWISVGFIATHILVYNPHSKEMMDKQCFWITSIKDPTSAWRLQIWVKNCTDNFDVVNRLTLLA